MSQRVKERLRNKLIKLAVDDDDETRRKEFEKILLEYEKCLRSEQGEPNYCSATKSPSRAAKKKFHDDNDDKRNDSRHPERKVNESIEALDYSITKMTEFLMTRMMVHERNTILGVRYLLRKEVCSNERCKSILCKAIKKENQVLKDKLDKHIAISKEILAIADKFTKLTLD